jgi:hypothetical protein
MKLMLREAAGRCMGLWHHDTGLGQAAFVRLWRGEALHIGEKRLIFAHTEPEHAHGHGARPELHGLLVRELDPNEASSVRAGDPLAPVRREAEAVAPAGMRLDRAHGDNRGERHVEMDERLEADVQ